MTVPPESVTKTPTSPPGSVIAAGLPLTAPGDPVPAGPSHFHSFGAPACCQACRTWLAAFTANKVRAPPESAATAGLLTRLAGELPTVRLGAQVAAPIGCW